MPWKSHLWPLCSQPQHQVLFGLELFVKGWAHPRIHLDNGAVPEICANKMKLQQYAHLSGGKTMACTREPSRLRVKGSGFALTTFSMTWNKLLGIC